MTELSGNVPSFFPCSEVRPFQDEFIKTVSDAAGDGRSPRSIVEEAYNLPETVDEIGSSILTPL